MSHLVSTLEARGLVVEVGDHVLDRHGYLAGTDEHRLADLNSAIRDPGVRAIIATRGGKGAYRIAGDLDFDAAARNRPLLVGFSEITILHLALLKHANLSGVHGGFRPGDTGNDVVAAMTSTDPVGLMSDADNPTRALTTSGSASGRLVGGNQDLIATASGWVLPSFEGAILLLEAVDMRLGHIDRQLTMLEKTGAFDKIAGIAVGTYYRCGSDATTQGDWSHIDVLGDRLYRYGVPVLGGLPIGHGPGSVAVPHATMAEIDTNARTLIAESAVE